MQTPPLTQDDAKTQLRAMRIFCFAVMGGLLIFSLLSAGITYANGSALPGNSIGNILLGLSAAVALLAVVLGTAVYRKKLLQLREQSFPGLTGKLAAYRGILILYYAVLDGAALLAVTGHFLTGNFIFLAIAGAMLIAMFIKLPLKTKLISELQLGSQEQQELE
jgi:hypothetical protein